MLCWHRASATPREWPAQVSTGPRAARLGVAALAEAPPRLREQRTWVGARVPEAMGGRLLSSWPASAPGLYPGHIHPALARCWAGGLRTLQRGLSLNMSLHELAQKTQQQLPSLIGSRHVTWSRLAAREAGKCLL